MARALQPGLASSSFPLTFQISDPVRDSSLTVFFGLTVVRTVHPYREGLHRCVLLTGPHTFAAVSVDTLRFDHRAYHGSMVSLGRQRSKSVSS
jgi:hypothetical protein